MNKARFEAFSDSVCAFAIRKPHDTSDRRTLDASGVVAKNNYCCFRQRGCEGL